MTFGRVDANQSELTECFRKLGCSVDPLYSQLGKGRPDLLVSLQGITWGVEIKDFFKPPSAKRLTHLEKAWHASWQGRIHIIETERQAHALVTYYKRMAKIMAASIFLRGPGEVAPSLPQQKNNPEIPGCL